MNTVPVHLTEAEFAAVMAEMIGNPDSANPNYITAYSKLSSGYMEIQGVKICGACHQGIEPGDARVEDSAEPGSVYHPHCIDDDSDNQRPCKPGEE